MTATTEIPIYVRAVGAFREATSLSQIEAAAEKYRPELERLKQSENDYDIGNYHAIREAYKHYRGKIIRSAASSSPH